MDLKSTIKILLIDDHQLVREGVRLLLEKEEGLIVVGEAEDGRGGIAMVEQLQPDVVLMDISMDGMNGLEALSHIVRHWPRVRVIILTMYSEEEYTIRALRSGAHGYVLKNSTAGELQTAIRAVAAGESYLSPAVAKRVVTDYVRLVRKDASSIDLLTARQREILQLLAEGNTMNRIAEILGLSVKTVETHKAELMDRLNIHHLPGLVRYAMRTGLITLHD